MEALDTNLSSLRRFPRAQIATSVSSASNSDIKRADEREIAELTEPKPRPTKFALCSVRWMESESALPRIVDSMAALYIGGKTWARRRSYLCQLAQPSFVLAAIKRDFESFQARNVHGVAFEKGPIVNGQKFRSFRQELKDV